MCSTERVALETPIESTPTTTVEKKHPDRTARTARRAIADMRRIKLGFSASQCYPVRGHSVESIARLLAPMTVSLQAIDIKMEKRGIDSAFPPLRWRPALSLLMCAEIPGCFFAISRDLALLYLAMPFGWNGAPANFAIFGDAITRIHAKFGTGRPDWFLSMPSLSKLYDDDGLLCEMRNAIRRRTNALPREYITLGLLWQSAQPGET